MNNSLHSFCNFTEFVNATHNLQHIHYTMNETLLNAWWLVEYRSIEGEYTKCKNQIQTNVMATPFLVDISCEIKRFDDLNLNRLLSLQQVMCAHIWKPTDISKRPGNTYSLHD